MLSGDLTTMALADVLQWADATRASGVLYLERQSERVFLQVDARSVVAASDSPSQPVPLYPDVVNATAGAAVDRTTLALEHLLDQFLNPEGRFRFEPRGTAPGGAVALDMAVVELLMEGLRLLDEWPRINALYKSDAQSLHVLQPSEPVRLRPLQEAVLRCAHRELPLSEARMALGLSRPALLRRVDELRVLGCAGVDGAPDEADLTERLISQATKLLRERQFDEAAHVFSALLATDPTAKGLAHLLRQAEQEQLMWLYDEVPPAAVPHVDRRDFDRRALTHADREVLERVNGRWDVSVLVLTSPLRETETLKCLRKLLRLHVIQLEGTPG